MQLISCNSNIVLSKRLSNILAIPLFEVNIGRFSDNEIRVEIRRKLYAQKVVIIQSMSHPVNDNIMELLLTVDAVRRSGAEHIIAVVPYLAYARQDRYESSPISSRLLANLLETAGIDELITMELHARQISGFFNIPVHNLSAIEVFKQDILQRYSHDCIVVSPDFGGVMRGRKLADALNSKVVIMDKLRDQPEHSKVMNVIGADVYEKDCLIIDDMIGLGGTLCNAAAALKAHGARSVCAYATHGLLVGNSIENLQNSGLQKIVITDTIDHSAKLSATKNIQILSIADVIAKTLMSLTKR